MITDNFNKICSTSFVILAIAFIISAAAFVLLKDFIVFILTNMYEFFLQLKLGKIILLFIDDNKTILIYRISLISAYPS
jgi:hypothetical protein